MIPTLLLRQIHPSPIGFGFWLWQLYDWLWPSAHHSSSSRSIMTTERCCTATTGLKKASAAQNQQDENLEVGIVVAWNVRLGSSSSSSRLNAFFYCFDSNYSACHFWKQLWNRRRVSCWMVWLAVWVALEYVVELAELGYMPYCSTTLWPSLVGGLGGE